MQLFYVQKLNHEDFMLFGFLLCLSLYHSIHKILASAVAVPSETCHCLPAVAAPYPGLPIQIKQVPISTL